MDKKNNTNVCVDVIGWDEVHQGWKIKIMNCVILYCARWIYLECNYRDYTVKYICNSYLYSIKVYPIIPVLIHTYVLCMRCTKLYSGPDLGGGQVAPDHYKFKVSVHYRNLCTFSYY